MMCVLRFLEDMPYGWVFITFAILLRMTEGVGSSLSVTATNTLLPELFPNRVGFVTVNQKPCAVHIYHDVIIYINTFIGLV